MRNWRKQTVKPGDGICLRPQNTFTRQAAAWFVESPQLVTRATSASRCSVRQVYSERRMSPLLREKKPNRPAAARSLRQ